MTIPTLPLENMSDRHYGLTDAIASSYYEAACISLERHHTSPKQFLIKDQNENEQSALVQWNKPGTRTKAAWANLDDATRDGAYALAIAASELSLNLYAIRRAETLTGADYYLAPSSKLVEDLEECFRLEVSGTSLEEYEVKRRLQEKIEQTKKGKSNLPALAVVVGFKVKQILMHLVLNVL